MKDGYLIFNYCTILIEEFYVDKNLGQNFKFEVEISAKMNRTTFEGPEEAFVITIYGCI